MCICFFVLCNDDDLSSFFQDRSVCHNSERHRLSHEFRSRALSLTQKLEHVKFDKEEKEKKLKMEFQGIQLENKAVSHSSKVVAHSR